MHHRPLHPPWTDGIVGVPASMDPDDPENPRSRPVNVHYYHCRRAEWLADAARFDQRGALIHLLISSSTPLTFLLSHIFLSLFLLLTCLLLLRYPQSSVSLLSNTTYINFNNLKQHHHRQHVSRSRHRPHRLPPWKGRPHHRCRPWYRSWLCH